MKHPPVLDGAQRKVGTIGPGGFAAGKLVPGAFVRVDGSWLSVEQVFRSGRHWAADVLILARPPSVTGGFRRYAVQARDAARWPTRIRGNPKRATSTVEPAPRGVPGGTRVAARPGT